MYRNLKFGNDKVLKKSPKYILFLWEDFKFANEWSTYVLRDGVFHVNIFSFRNVAIQTKVSRELSYEK